VRTLPLRLAPLDGESLPGYLARYSHTFAIPPGDVVRAFGLSGGAGAALSAGRYGVWLSPQQLHRATVAGGLTPATLQGMLLTRFAGYAFPRTSVSGRIPLAREVRAREVFVWSSRFCPRCLRENGAWLLAWQLGWSVVCVRHRVLLVRCCPKCGRVPRIGPRARWPRDGKGEIRDPTRCTHYHRNRGFCRARLVAAKTVGVAGNRALLAAQQRIDELLAGRLRPMLAGEEVLPAAYLHDLRALATLLRGRTDRQPRQPDADRIAVPRASGWPPRLLDDLAAFSSVLPEAVGLADLPDHVALTDALRELADTRYQTDGQTLRTRALGEVSAPLGRALRTAVSQSVYAAASSRMGFHPRAYRRPEDLDPRLEPRHVPQLFWEPDYERDLAGLFELTDFSPRLARRFCSVLLTRLLAPLGWYAAVRHLDLPESFVNDGYNTAFGILRRHGQFEELLARIKRLANQRAEHELIDYKQRRATLADWTGIDPPTWRLLQRHSRPTSVRHVHASIWLWCQLTSGHEHAAPVAFPRRGLPQHTPFVQHFSAGLREQLLLFGGLLLNTAADARQTLPTQLAVALRDRGEFAGHTWLDAIDPLVAARVLAYTSAHTGIETTALTKPCEGSRAPAAVTHARLLAAALLRRTALASWAAVAATLGGSPCRIAVNDRDYRAALEHDPALARELQQLERAIRDWQTPTPATPTTPHTQRMHSVAAKIRAHAAELFSAPHGTDLALRTSILACRAHTDLTWAEIAAVHDIPVAQPTWTQATVARRRRENPSFDHECQQLLHHANTLQQEAGFADANLTRGLRNRRRLARHN
jgi:hypothetical protein